MFAMGAVLGPTCLLKLLRYRFSGSTQGSGRIRGELSSSHAHDVSNSEYAENAAVEEYQKLMTLYDAWRVQRREFGPDWQCGDCGMKFAAAAYDVN